MLLSPFLATQSPGESDGVVTIFANEAARSAGLSIRTVLGERSLRMLSCCTRVNLAGGKITLTPTRVSRAFVLNLAISDI
jgi:hypothetical protein